LYDPDTALVRFGARDYDAEIGRWLAADEQALLPAEPNRYTYVFSNPVTRSDPSGRSPDGDDSIFVDWDLGEDCKTCRDNANKTYRSCLKQCAKGGTHEGEKRCPGACLTGLRKYYSRCGEVWPKCKSPWPSPYAKCE
jgi:RHS repeat-associated protein